MAAVNAEGRSFLTHTVLDGHDVIRVAVGSVATGRPHVERLWADLGRLRAGLSRAAVPASVRRAWRWAEPNPRDRLSPAPSRPATPRARAAPQAARRLPGQDLDEVLVGQERPLQLLGQPLEGGGL